MLDNIRNLIRHGRQALDGNAVQVATTENHSNTANHSHEKPTQKTIPKDSNKVHEHHADELKPMAENIVHQETLKESQRVEESRRSIEKYQMGDVLGEGAFSVVYSAIDKTTNAKVAIKVIKKYQLDEKQRNSVMKEVKLMSQLNHPNIVRLIDFVESDDYYYIIQEVVSGGEIFNQIVKFTYFSEDLSRHVIVQVAEALLYMHEQVGIVHRDLKPENIFFKPIKVYKVDSKTRQSRLRRSDNPKAKVDEGKFVMNYGGGGIGLIKIGDFGLSKQISLNNKNALQTPCGTIGYTAPEIVRDQRYSKEVDMWALGCVLYILLCGFPPFFNDSIEELTRTVARGEFKFLSPWWDEISDGAKHCVSRLLTVNPRDRYNVEEFLKDPWIVDFLHRSEEYQLQQNQAQAQAQAQQQAPPQAAALQQQTNQIPGLQRTRSGMPGFEVPDTIVPKARLSYSESLKNIHHAMERNKISSRNGSNEVRDVGIGVDMNMLHESGEETLSSDESTYEDESMFDNNDTKSTEFGVELHRVEHANNLAVEPNEILDPSFEPGPEQLRFRDQDDDTRVSKTIKRKKRMGKNTPIFTPEIKAMKDIFDMSIAAHRIHEENEFKIGETLLEEDEEEEDPFADEVMDQAKENSLNNIGGGFNLNMGDASILARRRNKVVT